MKKAGCKAINYGVESVNEALLRNLRKGITIQQIEETVKTTRRNQIKANIFLMMGILGDTYENVEKIKDFLERVTVDGIHISLATPFPGTEFWDWVEKHGKWTVNKKNMLDWPSDDTPESYPVFETKDFTAKERLKAYQKIRIYLKNKNLLLI